LLQLLTFNSPQLELELWVLLFLLGDVQASSDLTRFVQLAAVPKQLGGRLLPQEVLPKQLTPM